MRKFRSDQFPYAVSRLWGSTRVGSPAANIPATQRESSCRILWRESRCATHARALLKPAL